MAITILTSQRKWRRFLVYDLEWIPRTLQIRLCGLYDGHRYQCFGSIRDFIRGALTSENRGAWFYAHAGGLADVQFVLRELILLGYQVKCSMSGSSAIIVHVKQGKNVWHFLDSYWTFRDSLRKIGETIGLIKGGLDPMEDDESTVSNWYATAPLDELRDYNEQDCLILYRALREFELALWDLGGQLQMTIAGSGLALFRRAFLRADIETDDKINEVASETYTASRVEVFDRECFDANYYDFNSSFPYSMTFPQPGNLVAINRSLPNDPNAIYIAKCRVTVPECYLPPIPYKHFGRTFFPFGQWEAWLTSVDVQSVIEQGGTIDRVTEVLHFAPFSDLAEYVKTIYAKRKAAQSSFEKLLYKYLLNCLYGKFGESETKRSLIINPESYIPPEQMYFPGTYWVDTQVPINHRHVPLSSHITALSRRLITRAMVDTTDEIHYCDTDGFSTLAELDESDELGALKLEKRIKHGQYIAPKVYRIDGLERDKKTGGWKDTTLVKAKGFRLGKKKEVQVKNWESIKDGNAYEQPPSMRRIRSNFARGLIDPIEDIQVKKLCVPEHRIHKRLFYPDGKTRPYDVKEIQTWLKPK